MVSFVAFVMRTHEDESEVIVAEGELLGMQLVTTIANTASRAILIGIDVREDLAARVRFWWIGDPAVRCPTRRTPRGTAGRREPIAFSILHGESPDLAWLGLPIPNRPWSTSYRALVTGSVTATRISRGPRTLTAAGESCTNRQLADLRAP